MCKICKNVKKFSIEENLVFIAKTIEKKNNPEHFEKIINQLLGIKETEKDVELDEMWEIKNRG